MYKDNMMISQGMKVAYCCASISAKIEMFNLPFGISALSEDPIVEGHRDKLYINPIDGYPFECSFVHGA